MSAKHISELSSEQGGQVEVGFLYEAFIPVPTSRSYRDAIGVFADELLNLDRILAGNSQNGLRCSLLKTISPITWIPQPPMNAEFILHLLLRKDEREAVIGDLVERYVQKLERFGERRARLWFYCEVLRSVWPLLRRTVAKAGGLIAAGEWIRRHIS